MKTRDIIVGIFSIIAIVLVVIVLRLSRSELALIVGLTCGLLPGLLTTTLVFLAWRKDAAQRRREAENGRPWDVHRLPQPPVVVIPPGAGYPTLPYRTPAWDDDLELLARPRSFNVIGSDLEDGEYVE